VGGISDYTENSVLDHVFGVSEFTPPSTVYLGLSVTDPLDDASGISEPSGNGYLRKAITFMAAGSRTIENNSVSFNQATGSWGTISHWFICDNVSGTNFGTDVELLAYGGFLSSEVVVSGHSPFIMPGTLSISCSSGESSNYLANKILDFIFRNQVFSQPIIYLALTTTVISDSDTGSSITEPSGGSYVRLNHTNWDTAISGTTENTGAATFPEATASWGTVVALAIVDATSSGNLLFYDNDGVADTAVDSSNTVRFVDGAIDISLN
jgi:hypothetical protein